MILEYSKEKEKLLTNYDENCRQFFIKKGYPLEYGYCQILEDNLDEAKRIFNGLKDVDVRAHWALFMISLIEGNVLEYPTYFELRNFLEIDLNILIHYYKGDFVEKIVRYADFMFSINPEVYKFIGRVFYNNNLFEQSKFFLKRAKSYFYNDPELHYLLAYIFYSIKDYTRARIATNDCLAILPKYYPAVAMSEYLAAKGF